jgi:biopolymer transport protein ExbB/TolQ
MNRIDKNKWQVRGAVLGIFLLGFLAGMLALNFYNSRSDERPNLERLFEQLQLDEAQQKEVRGIFEEAGGQMRQLRREHAERRREIRRQTDERLQKTLSPEQWREFEQIRNARLKESGRERRE